MTDLSHPRISKSEETQNMLLEFILEAKLKPGDRLPSEDELATRFNVSRVSIAKNADLPHGPKLFQGAMKILCKGQRSTDVGKEERDDGHRLVAAMAVGSRSWQ